MNGIHEVTGSIPVRSTNLRSMIDAEVVHHSLARIQSQATVDLPSTVRSELRLAGRVRRRMPTRNMSFGWHALRRRLHKLLLPQATGSPYLRSC